MSRDLDPDAVRVQAAILGRPCGPLEPSRRVRRWWTPWALAWILGAIGAGALVALFFALVLPVLPG